LPYFTSHDGTELFYRRWGAGAPIVLAHAWALNADGWQPQMIGLSERGFSCIAFDRRGHGRSDDPGAGYDLDSLADDLHALVERLDLTEITLVGHSIGAQESVRYLTRHGDRRVARLVLIAPALPYLLRTADNPDGPNDPATLEAWREMWKTHYVEWLAQALPAGFASEVAPQRLEQTLHAMLQCTIQAAIGTNIASNEADQRAELRSVAVPTLILHGDKDASCPLEATGRKVEALIGGSRLKIYPGGLHAIIASHAREVVDDISDFIATRAPLPVAL
jgi:non-heme chloroperoxidase